MRPGELDFEVLANADFGLTLHVQAAGAPIDFTGWSFVWEARPQPGQTGPALIRLNGPGPRISIDPGVPGSIFFSLPWEIAAPHIAGDPLRGRPLYHDFTAIEPDGWRNILFRGKTILKPGVTRP